VRFPGATHLAAAIQRTEFLLYGILAGLITPVAKKEITVVRIAAKPVIQ
jgi:hypothetical protein